jgi:hypothetical protein
LTATTRGSTQQPRATVFYSQRIGGLQGSVLALIVAPTYPHCSEHHHCSLKRPHKYRCSHCSRFMSSTVVDVQHGGLEAHGVQATSIDELRTAWRWDALKLVGDGAIKVEAILFFYFHLIEIIKK